MYRLESDLQWGKRWKNSNFVTPDDSARNRKMCKMNVTELFAICLMPIFGLERYIEFGLPKAVLPSCVESLLLKQNPTLIYLRNVKSFVFRAGRKVPHCQKWDCHTQPLFAWDRAISRLFSISILIAGETKNGLAKSTSWSVWQSCFWGCNMSSERTQLLQKFARNHETTKGRKDDTNIHVLNWGGPLLGVQKANVFKAPKMRLLQWPFLRKIAQL